MTVITYHMSTAVPVIKSRLQQWFSKSLTSSVWPAAQVTFNKFPRIIIITTRYCSVDLLPRSSFSTSVAIQVLCPALSSRLLVILLLVIFSALSSACKKVPRSASTPRSHSPHFDWGHFSKTDRLQHMLQSLSLFTSNFWNLKKNLFSRHNRSIHNIIVGFLSLFIFRQQAYKKFSKTYPTQYEGWCDISHPLSVYCLRVVLHAIFPRTPSSADQQYVTLWPTNTIYNILRDALCNILANNMQYSDQQL